LPFYDRDDNSYDTISDTRCVEIFCCATSSDNSSDLNGRDLIIIDTLLCSLISSRCCLIIIGILQIFFQEVFSETSFSKKNLKLLKLDAKLNLNPRLEQNTKLELTNPMVNLH